MELKHNDFAIEIKEDGTLTIKDGKVEIFLGKWGERTNLLEQALKVSKELKFKKQMEEEEQENGYSGVY